MTVPDYIRAACQAATDYSPEFSARVSDLARELSRTLETTVTVDADMNYRAGQSLSFKLTVQPSRAGGKESIEVRVYISSKAPLFGVYILDVKGRFTREGEIGHPVPEDRLPASAREVIERCRRVLTQHGYREVPRDLFDEPVPGCLTEMDGLPASVFQALFAEVV
jgi:hypothetical protein